MRRITTWLLSTISALVLLFSYHTSTGSGTGTSIVAAGDVNGSSSGSAGPGGSSGTTGSGSTGSTDTPSTTTDPGTSGSSDAPAATPDPAPSEPAAPAASSGTFTGDAIETRFGPVQVEITVSGGQVTKSVVTQVPWNDRRDQEINSYAVPILNDEAVQAQGAGIDMVSGATFTSDGYIQSLQSALDQANL